MARSMVEAAAQGKGVVWQFAMNIRVGSMQQIHQDAAKRSLGEHFGAPGAIRRREAFVHLHHCP